MKKTNLKGMTLAELEEYALSVGEQRFRGRQLFNWLYTREVSDFSLMSSLSKKLREKLADGATVESLRVAGQQRSDVDGTTKFLFELADGKKIESVLIPPRTAFVDSDISEDEQQRLTLCISTQVGCPLDCAFCATAGMGFHRNLTSGEILDQLLQAKHIAGRKITNLVYMGMGEPLLNYEHVMKSVEIITTAMGIAARRITISTAGIVPQIRRMADEDRKVKLAISLHSLDEQARTALMPINKKYPLADLVNAADYYYHATRRRVTFEYILFDGWNDSATDLARLIRLGRSVPCKINIIPFHAIDMSRLGDLAPSLRPASPEHLEDFAQHLRRANITVFVRSSAGQDIDGACGQLAVKLEKRHRPALRASAAVHHFPQSASSR